MEQALYHVSIGRNGLPAKSFLAGKYCEVKQSAK